MVASLAMARASAGDGDCALDGSGATTESAIAASAIAVLFMYALRVERAARSSPAVASNRAPITPHHYYDRGVVKACGTASETARVSALEPHAGRPDGRQHRLLLEARLVGVRYRRKARVGRRAIRDRDDENLARLARDRALLLVAILALRIDDRESIGKARRHLLVEKAAERSVADTKAFSDIAAEE